eukprot:scaffold1220_cov259-Pinguiococcus_pyrenoidosus.AAC.127
MRAFFELCARLNANETYRAWRGSDFVDAFRVYVVEELRRRPSGFSDLGERFCKEIYDDYLAVYEHWEGGYIHWGKIPWRRSAIEWFKLVLGQSTADAFGFTTVEIDRVDRGSLLGLHGSHIRPCLCQRNTGCPCGCHGAVCVAEPQEVLPHRTLVGNRAAAKLEGRVANHLHQQPGRERRVDGISAPDVDRREESGLEGQQSPLDPQEARDLEDAVCFV